MSHHAHLHILFFTSASIKKDPWNGVGGVAITSYLDGQTATKPVVSSGKNAMGQIRDTRLNMNQMYLFKRIEKQKKTTTKIAKKLMGILKM